MAGVPSTAPPAPVTMAEMPLHKRREFPTVNLGPLTTAFEPPDNCNVLALAYHGHRANTSPVLDLYQFNYGQECDVLDDKFSIVSSCVPPRFASAYSGIYGGMDDGVMPVYSPGLACPSGYQPVCTFYGNNTVAYGSWVDRSVGATVGGTYMAMLDAKETATGCCPKYE